MRTGSSPVARTIFLVDHTITAISICMTETHARTFVRTVAYRLTALAITALWTGLGDAVAIHVVLAVVQYVMERAWLKIQWGKQ